MYIDILKKKIADYSLAIEMLLKSLVIETSMDKGHINCLNY